MGPPAAGDTGGNRSNRGVTGYEQPDMQAGN